jgi:hypothetical protein
MKGFALSDSGALRNVSDVRLLSIILILSYNLIIAILSTAHIERVTEDNDLVNARRKRSLQVVVDLDICQSHVS